jgi:hypothetical protein
MDSDGKSMEKLKIYLEEPIKTFLKHTTKQHLEEDFVGKTFATHFLISRDLGRLELVDPAWQHFLISFS